MYYHGYFFYNGIPINNTTTLQPILCFVSRFTYDYVNFCTIHLIHWNLQQHNQLLCCNFQNIVVYICFAIFSIHTFVCHIFLLFCDCCDGDSLLFFHPYFTQHQGFHNSLMYFCFNDSIVFFSFIILFSSLPVVFLLLQYYSYCCHHSILISILYQFLRISRSPVYQINTIYSFRANSSEFLHPMYNMSLTIIL